MRNVLNELLRYLKIYPCKTKEFYESYLYGVHVHLEEKSAYTRLDSLDEGEVYLKSISRQMSQAGSDFFKMHSDEENKNLEKKFAVLSEQVKIKSEQLEKSEEPNDSNVTKKFKDTGDILLVGINYDKKTKKHECVIEQYEK